VKKNKLLLTSVFKPFGTKGKYSEIDGRHALPELFRGQIMIAQDIFAVEADAFNYGLDLIAMNLETPTTVLHFPSLKEFEKELKKGDYTHVGINFVIATIEKAKIMSKLIREKFPKTKICFGGHGTRIPEAKEYCDYLCQGEGVDFFRELFKEPKKDYEVPLTTMKSKILHFSVEEGCTIPFSVGCPNGCDFCSTSHHFNRRVHRFIKDGYHLLDKISEAHKKWGINLFYILAEDFLLERDVINVLIKEVPKLDFPIQLSGFASLKAISLYKPEDIAKAGITGLWVGIEGKTNHFEKAAPYDAQRIIKELHDVGVSVLCSYILGLKHHSEDVIKDELKWFLSLQSDASQFLIYGPCWGTPLREKIEKEKLLLDMPGDIPYVQGDGFSLTFKHKIPKRKLEELQYYCFKKDYEELGPTALRSLESTFKGYKNLKKSNDKYLRYRSEIFKQDITRVIPLLLPIQFFAPSEKVKNKVKRIKKELKEEFGDFDFKTRMLSNIALASAIIKKLSPKKWKYNPKLVKNEYNMGEMVKK
jgi:haloalkane dehalogenase